MLRGLWLVDAGRTAGEDKSYRGTLGKLLGRRVPGDQFAVDVGFADASRDKLAILRSEVDLPERFDACRSFTLSLTVDAWLCLLCRIRLGCRCSGRVGNFSRLLDFAVGFVCREHPRGGTHRLDLYKSPVLGLK